MKVVWRRKNLEQHLVQLKRLYKESLFTRSGVYSCLAFFSLGMMNIIPTASQIQEGTVSMQETALKTDEEIKTNATERCYWQEDVASFFAFREKKKNTSQTGVPCEMKYAHTVVNEKKEPSPARSNELGTTIYKLTEGYPIQTMTDSIATYDREVAALIVGIAKKESDWGKHVPVDASGADCFNYWGYKSVGTRGTEMGHACFGSPEEAVLVVGNRLKQLVAIRETSAPADMIVWKCGSTCKGHSSESVRKWIADVSLYYNQIVPRPVTYMHE